MNRRHFVRRAFHFSAAAALARGAGFSAAAVAASSPDAHHLLAIGDFGSGNEKQRAVAAGMKRYVDDMRRKPGGLLLLGDNFYAKMEGGVNSARWQTGFEQMYPATHFPGPCWAILGNHDYLDNTGGEQTQLAYAAAHPGPRWTMPAKWYRFDFPAQNPVVTFLCLDTDLRATIGDDVLDDGRIRNSLTAAEEAAQLEWLGKELHKPRAAHTIVLGHHPLYCDGKHKDKKPLIAYLDGLLREHRVPLYLCGHDHDLQHIELEDHPTSFVISGAGGARLYDVRDKRRGPFAQSVHGFTHLEIDERQLTIRHLDANRRLLHAFTKSAQGRVTLP